MVIKTKVPIELWGQKSYVDIIIKNYGADNNSKAIILEDSEDGMPYAKATVFIKPLTDYHVTLDTNNMPNAEIFLVTNKIVEEKRFGNVISGFCSYPIYKLHPNVIKQLESK